MLNWLMDFSNGVDMSMIERVACALLVTVVASSVVMIVFVVLGYLVRSMVARYWMVLIGQLSCLPMFMVCLFYFQGVSEEDAVIAQESLTKAPSLSENQAAIVTDDGVAVIEDISSLEANNMVAEKSDIEPEVVINDALDEEFILDLKAFEEVGLQEIMMGKVLEYSSVIVWFWLFGVAVLLVKWSLGAYGLVQLRRSGSDASGELKSIFEALCRQYIKGTVRLRESAAVVSPMVVGWLKPVVFVPCGLMARMSPDQVEALLLHELAHIRRYDYFWNMLQRLSEVLFFFNPILWWSGKIVRQLREEICDGFVVAETQEPKRYAEALYLLEEARSQWLAVMAVGASLKRRFEILLGKKTFRQLPSFTELALLVVLGFVCFLPVAADAEDDVVVDRVPDQVVYSPLYGRVVDVDGNAVSGAKVMLYYGKNERGYSSGLFHPDTGILEEVISGKNGEYRFTKDCVYTDLGETKWTDHYAVIAQHPDWSIGAKNSEQPDVFVKKRIEPVEIIVKLRRPVSQTLNVILKGEKDRPLAGAKVHLSAWYSENEVDKSDGLGIGQDFGLCSGVTDENGKVTIEGLPPVKCTFVVTHPETGRSWKTRKYNQKNDWKTKCFPAAGVSGRVVMPDGKGLAGVTLRIVSDGSYVPWYVKTDAEGRYSIRSLYGKGHNAYRGGGGKGEYRINIDSGDWLTRESRFRLKAGEFKESFDLYVVKGKPVEVRVKNSLTGDDLPNALVRFGNRANSQLKFSDSNGRVRFNVLPGQYVFRMTAPEGHYIFYNSVNARKSVSIVAMNKLQTVKLSADVKALGKIEGKVISPEGLPVFDGEIIFLLSGKGSVYRGHKYMSKFVAELGEAEGVMRHFELDDVPADLEYLVLAQDRNLGLLATAKWKPAGGDFEIQLEREVSQKVRLTRPDGAVLKNQDIEYGEIQAGREVHIIEDLKTDENGEVTLTRLRKGMNYYVGVPRTSHDRATFTQGVSEMKELVITHKTPIDLVDENGKKMIVKRILSMNAQAKDKPETSTFLRPMSESEESWYTIKGSCSYMLENNYLDLRASLLLMDGSLARAEGTMIGVDRVQLKVVERILRADERIEFIKSGVKTDDEKVKIVVVNEEGEPILGAKLSSSEYQNPQLEQGVVLKFNETRVASDAQGEFSPVGFDEYLRIDAEGYATRWIPRSVLLNRSIKVTLQQRTRCEGVLRNNKGEILADSVFHFVTEQHVRDPRLGYYSHIQKLAPLRVGVRTDAEGRFSQLLEPGKWRMVGEVSDDFVIDEAFELKLGQRLRLNPQFKPSANLIVTARDQITNEKVPNVLIKLRKLMGPSSVKDLSPDLEGKDGELSFNGLVPGKYTVCYYKGMNPEEIGKNEYVKARVSSDDEGAPALDNHGAIHVIELKEGQQSIEVLLTRGVLVRAKVSSEFIKNFEEIAVGVEEIRSDQNNGIIYGNRCSRDGSLRMSASLLEDTPYRLIAYHAKNSKDREVAPTVSKPFIIQNGTMKEIRLELKRGGILRGRVRREDGTPMVKEMVRIIGSIDRSGMEWAQTDKLGNFIMKGIPPGNIRVFLGNQREPSKWNSLEDLFRLRPYNIEIKEGEETDIGDWVIPDKVK